MLLHTSFKQFLSPSVKVGLSAKFCVVVFKASILDWGSIGQSRFVCQFLVYWYSRHLCSITQGVHLPGNLPIWALMVNIRNCHSDQLADLWGSNCQSMFICQVLYTSIQGISAVLPGGSSARWSAKISFHNNITYYTWQIWTLTDCWLP